MTLTQWKQIRSLWRVVGVMLAVMLGFASTAYGKTNTTTVTSVYQNVLLNNSQQAVHACNSMQRALNNAKPNQLPLNKPFTQLVSAWKKVETTYILGSYDYKTVDYHRFIDMYNMGNENLHKALMRALASKNDVNKSLYKNSYKTIGALEIVLNAPQKNTRQLAMAKHITMNICQNLQSINQAYVKYGQKIKSDPKKATSLLLNSLIDSVYKAREWRIGNPAGLSRKYAGKPNENRAEYPLSGASVVAIQAILQTHQQVLGKQNYTNLATWVQQQGADEKKAVAVVQADLNQAIRNSRNLPKSKPFSSAKAKVLYNSLRKLHTDYYQQLMKSLGLVATILDADGD